jgi:branched-chain amino acid transport system permease protein
MADRVVNLASPPPPAVTRTGFLPVWAANLMIAALIAALWPLNMLVSDYMDPYFASVLLMIGLNVTLATSLNLINGVTGQFSLGHAAFMGIGGYVAGAILYHHVKIPGTDLPAQHAPMWLGLVAVLLGGLVAAVMGVLIGIPTLRLRGDYLAIATLGFGEIVYTVWSREEHVGPYYTGGSSGLHNIPTVANFFYVYALMILCVVAVWRLVHSAKGKAFLAVREDEVAAAAMGVHVTFYKVAAFVIGAFFAGLAGALFATLFKNLDPQTYRFTLSIDFVAMVVLGGSGSITGVILAAVLLTGLSETLHFLKLDQYRLIIYAVILIGMMLLRPAGLLGRREIWWSRRRLAPAGMDLARGPRDTGAGSQPHAP